MNDVSFSTTDHLNGILKLLEVSFPHETKYSKEYLEWLYLRNPYGVTISANLVEERTVNATYAVLPMRYRFEGQFIDAALSLNTATHPDFRGQGLFPKLANLVYESAAAKGKKIVLGVANQDSIGGFRKHLGFDVLGNVSLRLASSRSHLSALKELGVCASVTSDYLKWRLGNPSAEYSKLVFGSDNLLVAKRKIPFVIGASSEDQESLAVNQLLKFSPISPCFIFSNKNYGIDIPRKIIQSPWYLIVKNLGLSPSDYSGLKRSMVFCGLDSDTF